ncbi:hypothetical protein RI367_000529 [Sorochytrium milnesiophthora]
MANSTNKPKVVGGWQLWVMQWSALVRKHLLVLVRSPFLLLLTVLGPACMILVASAVASSLKSSFLQPFDITTDPTIPVELKLNVCTNSPHCRPAYYYAPKDAYHASVINAFALHTGLTVGSSLSDGDIVGFASHDEMIDAYYRDAKWLKSRPSAQTIAFTTFNGTDVPISSFADATERMQHLKLTTYSIGALQSDSFDGGLPYPFWLWSRNSAATKAAMDKAIIAVRRAQTQNHTSMQNGRLVLSASDIPDLAISLAVFPHLHDSKAFDPEALDGGTGERDKTRSRAGEMATTSLMALGFCPLLLLINQVVGQDKHQAHLGVLRKLSLFESAYWASLASLLVGLSSIIATLSVVAAKIVAPSYYVFANTSGGVLFVLQLLFPLSFAALGLLCVSVVSHPYSTTILTILVLVGCVLTCFALDSVGLFSSGIQDTFNSSNIDPVFAGEWFHVYASRVKAIGLSFLPFFHYGRIVAELKAGTAQQNFSAPYTFSNLTFGRGPFNYTVVLFNETSHYEYQEQTLYSVPAASLNLLWMAVLFVGYMMLGCVLNLLVPGRSGGASARLSVLRLAGLRRGHKSALDPELVHHSRSSSSVIVQSMTKRFGKHVAVNAISMTLRKGRCLALLGHNGAGKSTLINMLSGLLSPTSGNAYVFGHALTHGAAPIQRVLGTCSQDDIQYPELSAREHLRLYARFKGIPTSELKEYIDGRLDLVGLLPHADQLVGEYSGGMKRRLSIVGAGIGDPQFIILDEPTTGMDPINRRKVWQYIARLKRDCVLLLTSHSMEETDALGDDICIIDHGQVQATGTSLELKNAHGTGYQINLLTWQNRIDELRTFVTEALPQAHISASTATSLSVIVGREDMAHLPAFLSKLQTVMRLPESERVVRDWGLQNASLEQVFLKLTRKVEETPAEKAAQKKLADAGLTQADERSLPKLSTSFRLPTQIWAVITKNVAFQRKQYKANAMFVLIVIALLLCIHVLLTSVLQGSTVCPDGNSTFAIPPPWLYVMTKMDGIFAAPQVGYIPDDPTSCDTAGLKSRMKEYLTMCSPSTRHLCEIPDYGGFKKVPCLLNITNVWKETDRSERVLRVQFPWVDHPAAQVWVTGADNGTLDIMRNQTSLHYLQQSPTLATLAAAIGQDASPEALQRPFDIVPTDFTFNDRILAAQQRIKDNAWNGSTACSYGSDNPYSQYPAVQDAETAALLLRQQFPEYAISFANDASHATLYRYGFGRWSYDIGYQVQMVVNGQEGCWVTSYVPGGSDYVSVQISNTTDDTTATLLGELCFLHDFLSYQPGADIEVHHYISAVTNTFAQKLVGDGESIQSAFVALTPIVFADSGQMVAALFMVLIALWLFPMYLLVPYAEREERLFAYFQVNGLSTVAYWLGNYLYCLLMSLVFLLALVGSAKLYFSSIHVGLMVLTVLLSMHATIGLAFLYASVAGSSIIARLVAYLVPVIVTLPTIIVVFRDLLGATPFTSTWACLFPPVALAYSLRIVLQNYDLGLLVAPLVMMFVVGLVCIAASIYIALARERTASLGSLVTSLLASATRSTQLSQADLEETVTQGDTDPEVVAEVVRVDNIDKHNPSFAVKIQHLSKHYGDFAAVDDLTLGIDKGECFGLLGPNGCGKSTTVSMLGGTLAPSMGSATVGGFDTRDPSLPSVLGLCPQENRVMRDLTVEENLLFFARVRGANRKMAPAYARQAAGIVGLAGPAYYRAAEHLSGGMRRRLSIAVALIGLPSVIILDEPTTGLDPGNRMQIWDIIAKIRDRREHCIILISHLMEEVDALTSRIGIMAAGSLRCLGNQVSLKNRFASGYTLYVQMTVSAPTEAASVQDLHQSELAHIHGVTQFVQTSVCRDAVLRTGGEHSLGETAIDPQARSWTASFQYRLPGSVELARVFTQMEQHAEKLGVVEWSLNQSSLEDVFVEVATPYIR